MNSEGTQPYINMFQISSLTFSHFAFFAGFCFTETFDPISGKSRGESFFGLNHTYLELWLAGHSSPLGAVFWPHPPLCQAGPSAEPRSASGRLHAGPMAGATSAGPLWAEGSSSVQQFPSFPLPVVANSCSDLIFVLIGNYAP